MYNVNKTECNYLQTVFKDNGCTNQSCVTQSGETRPILDWEMIELFKDAPLILDHDTVTCYQLTQLPVECSKQVLELLQIHPVLWHPSCLKFSVGITCIWSQSSELWEYVKLSAIWYCHVGVPGTSLLMLLQDHHWNWSIMSISLETKRAWHQAKGHCQGCQWASVVLDSPCHMLLGHLSRL